MRILHTLAPAPFGGIESVVRALAAGQMARGHTVTVAATVDAPHHQFVADARRDGLTVVEIIARGRQYRSEQRAVKALLNDVQPNVVHTHGFRPEVLHAGVVRAAGLPRATTLHGFTPRDLRIRLYEWLQVRSVRRADAAIAVSRAGVDRLRADGVPVERIHLIRNAFSGAVSALDRAAARRILTVPLEETAIVWLGRLSSEKAPDVAIRAVAMMNRRATLYVMGDGPERNSVLALAAALGIADRVRLLGVVGSANTMLNAFDALLLSSRTEGTPMVLLEAMAAHVPIVATSVGGVPDVLPEGTALLAAADDPVALAVALDSVIASPEAAAERALRAHRHLVDQFGVEPWLDQHDALYASIVR